MKSIFKYFTIASLSGMLCLALAIPADAQHGGHGGGGGGFHGGGGGGGFRGGGGGGFSGGGGRGFSGGRSAAAAPSRSFSTPSRSFSTPQRGVQNNARVNNSRTTINNNSRTVVTGRSNAVVNGRVGVNGRIAVAGGRNFAGGRGYVGGDAFAARGGYFYNRGFYRSSYFPRLGFRVGFLPYGYYPFYWGDYQYYYSGGYFYNYDNGNYTVVEPPVGAAVNSLPSGAQPITINGQQYYELNGVYYLPITKDDGSIAYQVAGKDGQLDTGDGNYSQPTQNNNAGVPAGTHANPRIGDMIDQLPQDSRKVRINGDVLYVTPDDVYLKQVTDNAGNKTYSVVGTPDQQPEE